MRKYRIVVLGSRAVGKSCLTLQFVHSVFVDTYDPTVEDTYTKEVEVDGKRCMLEILDTLSVDYRWDNEQYIKDADGFILVYSITKHSTFEELMRKWELILKVKGEERIPVVLAGNKCDLVDGIRAVGMKEGYGLASEFGANFYETSAKSKINTNEIFVDLVKQIRNSREECAKERKLPEWCSLL